MTGQDDDGGCDDDDDDGYDDDDDVEYHLASQFLHLLVA